MKRMLDAIVSVVLLAVLLPVQAIIGLCVLLTTGSPVLYRQQRPGLHGIPFMLYKFRTMDDRRDSTGEQLPDADRLTEFGSLLRRWSLDELPQLWNVARGDMSFVGPRPLLMHYLERYTPEQARRHEVRPGITGWAQVNGRNAITWEEKFRLDVWYVDNRSFLLDLRILRLTVQRILARHGVSQPGHVTMDEFRGSGAP